MHQYYLVVWRRPRLKANGIKRDHGDSAMFFDEGEVIRECEDYGIEPEVVIQMVSDDARNWRAHPYNIDMEQVRKDAWADAWQMRPRFGT